MCDGRNVAVLVITGCDVSSEHLELPSRGVVKHAAVVGDLVEGEQQEAHVHPLYDGPEACHGSSNAHAHETVLCSTARTAFLDTDT
jgi:hypothetical protein